MMPSVLLLLLIPLRCAAWPSTELNSREYKTLLHAHLFVPPSPDQREEHIASVLKDLQQDLSMAAAGAGATESYGSFSLKKETPRLVRYFDTPGDCQLRKHQLTLRMRRSLDDNDDSAWEGMLKSRNGDRYHSAHRGKYVKGCNSNQKKKGNHKFEEDIGHFDWTGSVFSFSQKCAIQEEVNSLHHIATVWGDMDHYMKHELELDPQTPLALVGNTTITEIVYEDFWIDLDDGDDDDFAQAKVSLWYSTNNIIVAELSFRIKSKHEAWSDQTLMTMHAFWEQCATALKTKWLDPNSVTKTAWIYDYDPIFCHPQDPDGEDT